MKVVEFELNVDEKAILADYNMGREIKNGSDKRVAIFGGSGIEKDSFYFDKACLLGKNLASAGVSVMTGGGPGIMLAGNKGACESQNPNTLSYGIRVKSMKHELIQEDYLNRIYEFDTLSLRLLSLISSCEVAVLFPGGFGTLEELFSTLVRIRVGLLNKIPVYLFGKHFWQGLTNWMENQLIAESVIDQSDTLTYQISDNIDELSEKIIKYVKSR